MIKKTDIIERYARNMKVSKKDATVVIEKVLDLLKDGIIQDGGVDLYGFMKIEKIHKDACEKHNPRTGEKRRVDAKYVPRAKFSVAFKREVNA